MWNYNLFLLFSFSFKLYIKDENVNCEENKNFMLSIV